MKKFESPEIKIANLEVEDIVTTSGDLGKDETPMG